MADNVGILRMKICKINCYLPGFELPRRKLFLIVLQPSFNFKEYSESMVG